MEGWLLSPDECRRLLHVPARHIQISLVLEVPTRTRKPFSCPNFKTKALVISHLNLQLLEKRFFLYVYSESTRIIPPKYKITSKEKMCVMKSIVSVNMIVAHWFFPQFLSTVLHYCAIVVSFWLAYHKQLTKLLLKWQRCRTGVVKGCQNDLFFASLCKLNGPFKAEKERGQPWITMS